MDELKQQFEAVAANVAQFLGRVGTGDVRFDTPPVGKSTVFCMDDRMEIGKGRTARIAGSGILYQEDIGRLVRIANLANVGEITWHRDCGAARLWLEMKGEKNSTLERVDEAAREFAERFARKLGVPCREAGIIGRPGLHPALTIYVDFAGGIEPSRDERMPEGFVISAAYLPEEFWLGELGVALDIIAGHHGLGQYASPDRPIVVTGILQNAATANKFESILAKATRDRKNTRVVTLPHA